MRILIVLLAAFASGLLNAVAGGGTNISFPTLVWLGIAPVTANVTSAVGLWPANLGAVASLKNELRQTGTWKFWLLIPSAVGGIIGGVLLLQTPSGFFERIAPYLVAGSSVLLAFDPRKKSDAPPDSNRVLLIRRIVAILLLLVVSIYGGYFGAGIGILILTIFTIFGFSDLRQANALKNLCSVAIKGAAVCYFIWKGTVIWSVALYVAAAATVGGYAGGIIILRVSQNTLRWVVVISGMAMAVSMFLR